MNEEHEWGTGVENFGQNGVIGLGRLNSRVGMKGPKFQRSKISFFPRMGRFRPYRHCFDGLPVDLISYLFSLSMPPNLHPSTVSLIDECNIRRYCLLQFDTISWQGQKQQKT